MDIYEILTLAKNNYEFIGGAVAGISMLGYGLSKLVTYHYVNSREIIKGKIIHAKFSNEHDSSMLIQTSDDVFNLTVNTHHRRSRAYRRGSDYRCRAIKLSTILKKGVDVTVSVHEKKGTIRTVCNLIRAVTSVGTVPLEQRLLDGYTNSQLKAMVPDRIEDAPTSSRYRFNKTELDARGSMPVDKKEREQLPDTSPPPKPSKAIQEVMDRLAGINDERHEKSLPDEEIGVVVEDRGYLWGADNNVVRIEDYRQRARQKAEISAELDGVEEEDISQLVSAMMPAGEAD